MRIRIFLYVITGCFFGIVSWYVSFLNDDIEMLLRFLPFASIASLLLTIAGIWFLPAIFVASIEVKHAKDLWRPAFAVACLWTTMVITYYFYYAILIAVTGAGQLSFLRIVNATNPNVWEDWWHSQYEQLFQISWSGFQHQLSAGQWLEGLLVYYIDVCLYISQNLPINLLDQIDKDSYTRYFCRYDFYGELHKVRVCNSCSPYEDGFTEILL